MDALLMALRAIRWRRGASAAVLLISVFATGVAAAGPVYLAAAADSILAYTLRTADPTATGTGMELTQDAPRKPDPGKLAGGVASALKGRELRRAYPTALTGLEYRTRLLDAAGKPVTSTTVAYRADACGHLRIVRGRCASDTAADEVVVSRRDADARHWEPGGTVYVDHFVDPTPAGRTDRPMTIAGLYEPVDPAGGYWFTSTRHYFELPGDNPQPTDPPSTQAVFVARAAFARLGQVPSGAVNAVVDLPLAYPAVHTADLAALQDQLDRFGTGLATAGVDQHGFGGVVTTHLREVLRQADTGQRSLRVPMLLVIGQFLLLGWYVLFMVAAGAAEARGGEVALAKLRGLPATATVAFGLIESVLLLAVSVPLGVAAGLAAVRALAGPVFGSGVHVAFTGLAWGAALIAAGGGLVAAALGGVATFRRPVVQQWRRASRTVGARSGAVDAVVVALAAAGLAELFWGGSLGTDRLDPLALAAPGLVAVAGALLGARLLPPLARAGHAATRASRWIGLFVGLRQVARRPGGPRVVAVLATAFGLATFSVLSWSVFAHNRHDRAATEVGAARVVTVDPSQGPDLRQVVDRLDPDGRSATAVLDTTARVTAPTANPALDVGSAYLQAHLLGVEPARFAAVAYWRADYAGHPLAALTGPLSAPLPPPVVVTGDALRLTAVNRLTSTDGGVGLHADLTTAAGQGISVPLVPGDGGYRADALPCAERPCRLRRVYLTRTDPGLYSVVGDLSVTAVEAHGSGGWHPVDNALAPGVWAALNPRVPDLDGPVEKVGTGLAFTYAAPPRVQRVGVIAGAPARVPVVVTPTYAPPAGTNLLSVGPTDGLPLDATVVDLARVLPRAGDLGVLVDLDQLVAARPGGYSELLPNRVWLAPGAPADFPARLAAAGVHVMGVATTAERYRELTHAGPALAVALMLAGAAVAALLSATGAVVNLHLLARRRAFELAAMQALGVPRRGLRGAVAVEQSILVGFAVVLGVGLGTLGAILALPSVPEYADVPTFPPLLVRPDPGLVLAIAVAIAALLAVALAASGYGLLRAAVPARLRETQA